MTTRVAVVGGGRSAEHEVSLASAAGVAAALREGGFAVTALTVDPDGRWWHDGVPLGPDVASSLAVGVTLLAATDAVVPMLHGPHGEDGTLAALCDLAGVACVGSPVLAGAVAMDKWLTKVLAHEVGVAVAPGVLVRPGDDLPPWSGPVVVKPVAAGSSHGVTVVDDPAALPAALAAAFTHDDRALVERRVVGREVDVAVFRRADGTLHVGPPLEIVVPGGLFDTDAKYGDAPAEFRCPAALGVDDAEGLVDAAQALYVALGCAGVARFDFFLTAAGLVLNEVNTTPGSTARSQVPLMYAADGLGFAALLAELVSAAVVTYRAGTWDQHRRIAT
ncbi:D-alanine--D-alanine ligase family protein [Jatrophihabitans sp. YIM 134969]